MYPSRQRSELAETTYELFHAAAEFDLPLVVLAYPRFALDMDYARRRLSPVIGNRETGFAEAWTEAVDPSLVRETPIQVPRMAGLRLSVLRIRRAVKARLVR
jgi:hypothetical protein